MAQATRTRDTDVLVQAAVFILLSTLALTASFLGLVGLLTGSVTGIENRLPYYVLGLGLAFVGAIVALEREHHDGRIVIRLAAIAAALTFALVVLAGEGVAFMVQRPETVVSSQSLFYFLAAGLIGTGLGYVGMRHWEDISVGRGTGL